MYFESRGIRLHYRRWWVENARGVLVVSHGLGEHSGRYRRLARQLNTCGYSVYAADHFGHGQSPGRRGDIEAFEHYSIDLCRFVRLIRHENPGRPVHLLGHSMGAVIACGSVAFPSEGGRVESLILSAPAFRGAKEPGVLESSLLRLLGRLFPALSFPNRLDVNGICRDPEIVAAYEADDLVHDRVSPRWFTGYQRCRERLLQKPSAIQVPCLMLLPEGDRLVDPLASRAWFERLEGETHRLSRFPDAYHEVFNEPGVGEEALSLLVAHLNTLCRRGVQPERRYAGG
ncbi:lysophospholipase [Microbulbifer bruguierae]|uniref:Lysophospholipase n=1 Tax=Microbulbifer bruguierae TaxID=3029061 RepID=A0ABY8NDZ0_9GAMM|nr:alpha/beta hydrolase [Microbulbifer bruguierae]WGL16614.1 lysophospholipase [Microbulbifer bruguierae]